MTKFKRLLDVNGEIRAVHGNHAVVLTARRETITVDLPHLRGLLGHVRGFGGRDSRDSKVVRFGRVAAGLQATGMTLHFRMADRIIAKMGTESHPGLLSRLVGRVLGVTALEIRPAIISALFQSRRP